MNPQTRQLALGTVIGGLILYAVPAVGWAAFPWVDGSIHDLREPEAIAMISAHAEALPGTYFLNATEDRTGIGPALWGWMTIHPPEAYSFGRSLISSSLMSFGVAFLTAWVLLGVTGGYLRRVLVGGAIGLAALLAGPLYFWAWAWFSTPYALAMAGNHILAHGLVALALGRIVRGAPEVKTTSHRVQETT